MKSETLRFTLLLAGACLAIGLARAEKPVAPASVAGTTRVTAEAVIDLVGTAPNPVIIDTRLEEEFAKGHIQGAINLLDTKMERKDLARLAPGMNTPLVFYCNGIHCLRSSHAAKLAAEWGYKRIYWFRGGWQEWVDKQLPVSR